VSACPHCGEPAERGQLVCTSCGTRLALRHVRVKGTVPLTVLAILLALVVLGAGAFGFAVSEMTSDDGDDVTVAAEQATPEPKEQRQTETATPEVTGTPQEPTRSLLLEWPKGLTAHTVVLVTTSDRQAAGRLARQAARSGIEAGMLRSDDYNLGTGLWIVFAGRFATAEGAARQASDLAERYPGAYPQLVQPSS
jgi:predicted nucleic acid-binding Zn ribbon protein